jgi:NAD-dependent deacetylase
MEKIYEALAACNYFAAIGTSGHVYPAAGFVQWVDSDCHTIELNLEPSLMNSAFKDCRQGPATKTVLVWVREVLSIVNRC